MLLAWMIGLDVLLVPQGARARERGDAREGESTYAIDLVTVGPGDALLTRGGHAALAVVDRWPDGREPTTVYNFGDTDFTDPWLGLRFVFGRPRFFLSISGDLYQTAEYYGLLQNRTVYRQRLALSDAQAKEIAERLAVGARPENREYDYHYLERTCTTEIRDLLDDVLGGRIEAQLGAQPDPWTVRDYQQLTFDGDIALALLADVVFGRRHDEPIDRHFALMWPARMREYLQQVQVPDPAGSRATVPLAGEPELLAKRGGPPATVSPNRITWYFVPLATLGLLVGALRLRRRGRLPSRAAGLWLLVWSLPFGLLGLVLLVASLASSVPELRHNELVWSLPFTDLLLLAPAVAWLRGRTRVPWWLPRYATVRLLVVGAAVLARAAGSFIQQPWILPVASLAAGVTLWWLLRDAAALSRDRDRR